jgi:hypothetical protein
MELEESWMFGLWPKRLLIFEDRIEVRDFELLRERAEPKKYGWIDRVSVSGGSWLVNLLITGPGSKPILVRGLSKSDAERARALIEERMARANVYPSRSSPAAPSTELLIRSLAELRDAGVLSEEEFKIKRSEVIREQQKYR